MAKRWKQRPEGSTWGDWGDDDSLGRINLIDAKKRLEGVREVEEGISFCLSLPLDYPGGTDLNQRRYPPILTPTEDLAHTQDTFYNVHMSGMGPGAEQFVDMWCDDKVTLWLQYSTQWDALCHVGAEFDADGDGVEEAVYYNGFRAGEDLVGPQDDAEGTGYVSKSFAKHLGLEHMAYHGVQGRGVLIDLEKHLGTDFVGCDYATLEEIMVKDNVVVEPGDMVLFHTGFATQVLNWNRQPDPDKIHSICSYLDGRDPKIIDWIRESQLSALIADNYAVEADPGGPLGPDPETGRHSLLPIHHWCLFRLGVPLGELFYLEELVAFLRAHNRSRFLLTAPPLRLPGTAGGPVTGIATV